MLLFIKLGFFDILDILIVAFIFYQLYRLVKGTVAINIFAGIFTFYLVWLLVGAFNMELISAFLGKFIGMGVIALLIVFQPEVRRFLLLIGSRYNLQNIFNLEKAKALRIIHILKALYVFYSLSLSRQLCNPGRLHRQRLRLAFRYRFRLCYRLRLYWFNRLCRFRFLRLCGCRWLFWC